MNSSTPTSGKALPAFRIHEQRSVKLTLAARVASMMGRKMEEDDWTSVYCYAKGIPDSGWSNLNIDVAHNGLGVEHKLLRCAQLRERPIKAVCGTRLMHPAATRSIRIDSISAPAEAVKEEVFNQYNELIEERTSFVKRDSPKSTPDMRVGWLLWESSLTEFLYFEQKMSKIDPANYYATWNETPARGARKASKSLWVFDQRTNQKAYSVTTSAGIKIQPYFDVPSPDDENLYYFRVQSEPIDEDTVNLWVSARTARSLEQTIGSLEKEIVSRAILRAAQSTSTISDDSGSSFVRAVPVPVTMEAFDLLCSKWEAVSDEHRVQLLIDGLRNTGYSA